MFLVQKKDTGEIFAMKAMRKDVMQDFEGQVTSALLEKEILLDDDHPFLVGMKHVF